MTAQAKTKALARQDIPLSLLDPNPNNPNQMSDAEFNLLYDNMEKVGFVDPLFVRKTGDRYRVIGGHHRLEVAKLLEFETAPCTIIDDPEFDEDQEAFQVVRMNVIRGKMSPEKFLKMYQGLSHKYANDVMADAFGFAEQEQFDRLIAQMAKVLPKDVQPEFKQAAQEIKTIDGLSKLLNRMFTSYGDTLKYGYMVIDYGGKDSVWLRMSNDTRKALLEVGKRCIVADRTVDSIIGGLVQLIAQGALDDTFKFLVDSSQPVSIPPGVSMPTAEALNSNGV